MESSHLSSASLGAIAKASGVSKATACNVLRSNPGPSADTRERVLRIAREMGYVPDARMGTLMARVRDAKAKDAVPIAWLNTNFEEKCWEAYKFHSPYLEGARERALKSGYRIETIWAGQPGMTMRRLSQMIYQRGITGVIVTPPARHLRLRWDKLACVALEPNFLAPRFDRVMADIPYNLFLTLKMLRRYGYRRIGVFLYDSLGERSYRSCHAVSRYFHDNIPPDEVIPPNFFAVKRGWTGEPPFREALLPWVRQYKPDVIVGYCAELEEILTTAGYDVPHEIGVVTLATDDDLMDWAGINSRRREIGAATMGQLISHLDHGEFGIPATAENIMIRGTWHNGRTLIVPKPK